MNNYGIIAIHGGHIEEGTSEVAMALAGSDIPYFLNSSEKHITSIEFRSPLLDELLKDTKTIISIHGERDTDNSFIMIGGLDILLGTKIIKSLVSKGFVIKDNEKGLTGSSSKNVCNLGLSKKGVQLELSNKLRMELITDYKLMKNFVDSVRIAL